MHETKRGEQVMKKVRCLYRVSTLKQLDENDIPMQRIECKKFIDMMPDWEFDKEYIEKGVSGYHNKLNVPTIICMINTKDEKVDEKHPFPSSLLLPLYNDAFKKNKMIEKVVLVANADIVKIGEMLKNIIINYYLCI